jgi:ATP-dependent Clp protease ATP-binding subunit ClpC
MRLTFAAYVTVEREQGRSVYVCKPLSGMQIVTRDPLLSTALSKLSGKMRKASSDWIREGKSHLITPWLYDSQAKTQTLKLTLVLRDRTLRWKLMLVTIPAFDRHIVCSPSVPDAPFEVEDLRDLESRAVEVYSHWAQDKIGTQLESSLQSISVEGDLWVEPIEVEVETVVQVKKRPKNILAAIFGGGRTSGSEELHKVGQCLDDLVADFETVLGRGDLIEEIDRMLLRPDRQGVMIVGQPSSGKSAIFRSCVKRRMERYRNAKGNRPQTWWLSPQRLISGMSYLGQWEQRWLAILREATRRDHILYVDDMVSFFSAGRTRDSSLSAADVLRGYLSENQVRIVAEATPEELAILRRRDRALADRFHLVHVPSLDSESSLPIVLEATQMIEAKDEVFFHPETVPLIIRQQESLAPDRAFPGKAIEMARTLAKHSEQVITRNSVLQLAARQTGSTLSLLLERLGQQKAIRHHLGGEIIGQPDAVGALARVVVRFAQSLQPPDRPLGVLLFLGPTGVGKTESAKALTRLLFDDDSHLVRIDMNELTTSYAAEQLVGSFDEPEGRLTSAVRRQPNCVILLDEIEKAHPDVFDYLLQVLGEGRLTDARGRVADFRNSIIIMTSNLGAREQTSGLGFDVSTARHAQVFKKAAESFFRPEFFNRIDEVVAFRSLTPEDVKRIVEIQLDQVLSRDGLKRRRVFVTVEEDAIQQVVDSGFDAQLGARAVRRMLEREVIQPVGDVLAGLPSSQPALVRIVRRDRQLKCVTKPLSFVAPRNYGAIKDLLQLIEVGKGLHSKMEARLSSLATELRAQDERLKLSNHNTSYYALHEQVYRCAELLKAARYRIDLKGEPRLGSNPGPSTVKRQPGNSSSYGGGKVKRLMREWFEGEDLRKTIAESHSDNHYEGISTLDLTSQLCDSLVIAQAMISAALTPRRWLLGMQMLTTDSSYQRHLEFERGFSGFLTLGGLLKGPNYLRLLVDCLKHRFQYEVYNEELDDGYYLVSGVSLMGLVGPLLGTYQTQAKHLAAHLRVLHAIPVPEEIPHEELNSLIRSSRSFYRGDGLHTPQEQHFATAVIRGSLGREIVDYVSNSRLALTTEDMMRPELTLEKVSRWWMHCLPIPAELRAFNEPSARHPAVIPENDREQEAFVETSDEGEFF